ncbi:MULTISPECIES: branched-chain amino acid ABC transporter permease [Dactylosporangium]|uniref:Branched-chain amino acid ABC transporter permease n=2 Tax=Dactylosporangium TaxID=35753 RepID=A0A9W6KJR3_9ACTN|nr:MULTISPECIES: branched-chain amino acid ABC transporter permease [Dactylosporangium]UWZ46800.1 branched-chain amino acid ABC transporter permease [Dactylosporangium matsuzakiense]GLL01774.1 branched-chain amino acid ABC transporter permease [Dactylosporangium matsuzakiense]
MDAYLIPAVDGVAYGLLLFVVAAGLTLAFGVGDVLNLAHGTLFAFGAYAAAKISDGSWGSLALAVLVGTAAAGLGGALLSALLVPLANRGHLAQALLTFGVALVAGDRLTALFGKDDLPIAVPPVLDRSMDLFGHSYPRYRLALILVAALIAAGLGLVVTRSRAGNFVRATVDDRDMVAMLGVSPFTVRTSVLAGAGALAGLAGALGAPIIGAGPRTADQVLLLSLVVVVLGGMGSIAGALVAAIAVGEIQNIIAPQWPAVAPFALFGAMALALAARARGLLPSGRTA